MSYSRWSNSIWYTFWCTQSEDTENRDTAIFCICDVMDFTAKELRDDMQGCLDKVKLLEPDGDIYELVKYMQKFLKKVNEEYPKYTK